MYKNAWNGKLLLINKKMMNLLLFGGGQRCR